MGIANVVSTNITGERFGNLYPAQFDAILLDAVCSGEGTGFKSDFAITARKSEKIKPNYGNSYQVANTN